ncbi:MAG TPA: phosphatidate cytidylyltransferase [Mariprofundaceae bacterium]|nr:phosphatidate cytidylyltransferase [Mariprofundaceae bacterium]
MGELGKRIVTAVILLALVVGWFVWLPTPWFEWVLAAIGVLATWELLRLMKLPLPLAYLAVSMPIWWYLATGISLSVTLLMLVIWFGIYAWASRAGAIPFERFAGLVWMAGWLVMTVWVVGNSHGTESGRALLVAVCFGVWSSDIAAYFAGRLWGRHKLCPAISPGKSLEGLAAGLLVGVAVMAGLLLQAGYAPVVAAALSVTAVVAGVLGDLSESALKRMQGAKDSGSLLPGHGGILDRIDAIIMALPAAWIAWSML